LNDTQKVQKVIAEFCIHPIEKIRHKIEYGEFLWEVDEYKGENEGLVIAEVEFEHEEDYRKMLDLGKPPWVGKEITIKTLSAISQHPVRVAGLAHKETAGSSRSPAAEVRGRLQGRHQGAPVERGNGVRSCCQARTGERYPCRSWPCGPSSWPGCHELFFRKDSGGT